MAGAADDKVKLSGPVHTAVVLTGTSTVGSSSTLQVSSGDEPDKTGLGVSDTSLRIGSGTACEYSSSAFNCSYI